MLSSTTFFGMTYCLNINLYNVPLYDCNPSANPSEGSQKGRVQFSNGFLKVLANISLALTQKPGTYICYPGSL